MIMTPGSKTSRLAALVLLALVLLAAYQLILSPLLGLYQANQQQIAQKSDLLQRYGTLAAAAPGLKERLAEIDEQVSTNGYWPGPSDALAAAQMQDLVSDVIEGHGGALVSVQTKRADRPEDGASTREAALGLRLSATVDELAGILTNIETATPYLFIDRLVASPRRARQVGDAAIGEPELDVRLDVFGYLQDTETPPAGSAEVDARGPTTDG